MIEQIRLKGMANIERAMQKVVEIQKSFQNIEGAVAQSQSFQQALQVAQERPSTEGKPTETPPAETSPKGTAPPDLERRLTKVIAEELNRSKVDPALALAVMQVESGFDPNAVSPKGAMGLMQIMPSTGAELGVSNPQDLLDPQINARAGLKYLSQMLEKFGGDERLALAAYNAGPGAVQRYRGVPPYSETNAYVKRVMQLRARLDSDLEAEA